MRTLAEIEPRKPVNSLPGTVDALHVINSPGSYVLVGDMVVPAGKAGILVNADGVAIELNGFAIRGDGSTTRGIESVGPVSDVSIRGGRITDHQKGLLLDSASQCHLRELIVTGSSATGVTVGPQSLLDSLQVSASGGNGIVMGNCTLASRCICSGNTGSDLKVASGGIVRECITHGSGIESTGGALIESCHCEGAGIRVVSGTVVRSCQVSVAPVGIEILATHVRCRIVGNDVMNCTTGIRATTGCSLIAANSIAAGTTPFDVDAANAYGPLVDLTAGGDISASQLASNPYANHLYS